LNLAHIFVFSGYFGTLLLFWYSSVILVLSGYFIDDVRGAAGRYQSGNNLEDLNKTLWLIL